MGEIVVKIVLEKLADEGLKRYVRAQGIDKELKNLEKTLSYIQALLHDASQKEVTQKSVAEWLNGLRHLAYEIDDVLDDVSTKAMHRELSRESGGATTSKVRKFIPTCCTNLALSHRLSGTLDSINSKLQFLEKQAPGLGLVVIDENPNATSLSNKISVLKQKTGLGLIEGEEKPKSASERDEASLAELGVIGRESEKKKLVEKLLSDESSSEGKFSVIPIVGMGGVGKTTLARLCYNDSEVEKCFEPRVWVSVPDDFDTFTISKIIFGAVSKETKEFPDLNQLQIALKEQFDKKKFLLVLDDVWTERYDLWEKLVRPFLSGAPGSKIIVTTRKAVLLKEIGLNHLDLLEGLSDKDALSLLAINALGVDNFEAHPTLRPKGVDIVKKCGCLPLALKAVGRLLRKKRDGKGWDAVLHSKTWGAEIVSDLSKDWKAIFPALMLSYDDLPANLKHLFAYCSLFPRGFWFDKEELIQLWMAEGFLDLSNDTKSPEEFGGEYFDELLARSFFQHAESLFVMHDLMNELATFVAGEFFLRFDTHMDMGIKPLENYHHMSFVSDKYVAYQPFEPFKRAKSLRTFLGVSANPRSRFKSLYLSSKILVDILPELRLLRVLSLSHFKLSEVPKFIGDLKHLRYLNFSYTSICELPENVCNLYNLQTLIVLGCQRLIKLPKSFAKLRKLRHFDIRRTPLEKMPFAIGKLDSLQTLSRIIIGGDDSFAISELKGLKNLHGKISIEGLHNVQSARHAREASFSLKRPTELELKWGDGSQRETLEKEVLNELKPRSDDLEMLSFEGYGGTELSSWVGDPSFLQLVRVSISRCKNCTSLPPLGQLPSLKELNIQGMNEVKVIGPEFSGTTNDPFRSLEILMLRGMSRWVEWSSNRKVVFPRLQELLISDCPKLIDVSVGALSSLRSLYLYTCGDGVLGSLVQVSSSTTVLKISSISGLRDEVWRGVATYLGAVEKLRIRSCDEIRYLWESEAEASKVFMNLKELEVDRCSNFVSLGEKEGAEEDNNKGSNLLSSLRILRVNDCDQMEHCYCPNNIEILSMKTCSSLSLVSFPEKLKSLTIWNCSQVKNINNTSMPMLESLILVDFADLESVIQLTDSVQLSNLTSLLLERIESIESFLGLGLPNLTQFDVNDCKNLKSISEVQLPNLTGLVIINCENLKSISEVQLPNLTHLVVTNCENLKSISEVQLPNLTHLDVADCENLKSISEYQLPNLTRWRMIGCQNLKSFGVWPPKLTDLEIGDLKTPVSECGPQNFPPSLVHLCISGGGDSSHFTERSDLLPSSLTTLWINNFDKLESLSVGLQHLTSLQHLSIWGCPKLIDLPETLLPSLLSLEIFNSPELIKRCEGRGSHYWPYISHIPCIELNFESH